jgi:gluconate kinase
MIYLISGTTHTGKTFLAQRLLEEKHWPYLSLDHLKMGLIRSGTTNLTVFDDDKLTDYLWPIAREMVKTAIENNQNLIIEGCYIPHSWAEDFDENYRTHIQAIWLVMTKDYIETHFEAIRCHAGAIEQRLDDSGLSKEMLIRDNLHNLEQCKQYGCEYILIDGDYQIELI